MEYQVTAPDERNSTVVGVPFEDGVGFTSDPVRLAFFRRRGWDIEPVDGYETEPGTENREPVTIEGAPLTDAEAAAVAAAEAAGVTVPVLSDESGSGAQGVTAAELAEQTAAAEKAAPAKPAARKK